jgi:S1-C subfamily serine protease
VIAIGNPYGLSGTMTQGIVSALSRSLTVDNSDPYSYSTYTIPDIIQTDAAINPGNSGGVLVNVNGQVVGVTSAIKSSTSSNSGIGFVIPAHIVQRIVPVLIAKGSYDHPDLGFTGITLTPGIDQQLGLDPKVTGILVTDLTQNGPAENAGLIATTRTVSRQGQTTFNVGDVVTAIDGNPMKTIESLSSYIFNQTTTGQTVSLTLLRQGGEKTVDLTLTTKS